MPSPKLSLQTTTLWEYPSQHYGDGEQGSASYRGATPSWVIWNLLQRYTEENEVVLDPMCGSGTTLDVCRDTNRHGIGYDLQPHHPGVEECDARDLPQEDSSVDFVFCDPPYGQNLKYSGKEECIGELDARDQPYFDAMKDVFEEAWRVLKPGKYAAFYVCDVWTRKLMVPIGANFVFMLSQIFEMVDHIAVVRGNKNLDKGNYHKAAEESNFFLRGYNHLIIVRKPDWVEGDDQPKGKKQMRGHGERERLTKSEGARRGPSKPRSGRASDIVEPERGGKRSPGGGRPKGGGKPGGHPGGGKGGKGGSKYGPGRPGGKSIGGRPGGGKPGGGGKRGGGGGNRGR
jgi:DNA modification methylase